MIVIIIVAVLLLALVVCKLYVLRYDTVIAFTGGLGSGKTFLAVRLSLKLLRRHRFKVRLYNFFHKVKREMPLLYSSIPIAINNKERAVTLTAEHCLLASRIVPRSVVFIDEIGAFASQFDYSLPNVSDNFDEFVRLFRHYTLGGYLVVTEQCSDSIVLQVRRRLNKVFNLMNFRKWLGVAFSVNVRNIYVSDEIKTVEDENVEDGMSLLIGLMPFNRHYDTYCYSDRYSICPKLPSPKPLPTLKTNVLFTCPRQRLAKKIKTTNETDS